MPANVRRASHLENRSIAEQSSVSPAEQAFVAAVLGAFIAAARVGLDERELAQAMTLARSLWRVTFGEGDARA
jgi:hypothetical protein